MSDLVEWLIQDGIRALGIGLLKAATLGRYRASASNLLIEAGVGLLAIAAITWLAYVWWV